MRFSTCKMSNSASSCCNKASKRSDTFNMPSNSWRCSNLICKCAATVSTKRLVSSMPLTVLMTSDGIFLLSLLNCSNWDNKARRIASVSTGSSWNSSTRSTSATKNSWSVSFKDTTCARSTPSTNTFTVPSGSFSICNTLAMVPILCKSLAFGSSSLGFNWANKKTGSSFSIAASKAAIDLSRPTNNGITMNG